MKHHLKDRVPAQVSLRVQLFYQFLEGQVLVSQCPQRHFPNSTQQFSKRRIASQVSAQNQSVYKHPNQFFRLDAIATGNRRTYYNIILTRIAIQECRESG